MLRICWMLALGLGLGLLLPLPRDVAWADSVRQLLWQTNAGGDDIDIIDIGTGRKVRRLVLGSEPHGLAATADGRTVFATIEASGQPSGDLAWIDAAAGVVTRRMPICREPHALAASPDGRWLYIPCRDGHYRVVDGRTGDVVTQIRTGGRPHNTLVSRDGRWAFLSPMGGTDEAFVVDIGAGHRVAKRIRFANSLRPSALSRDGRYLFQQIDELNGFQVADVGLGTVVATVEHSVPLRGIGLPFLEHVGRLGFDGFERCHGIGIRPDKSEVWSVCSNRVTVHALAAPGFPELAVIALPAKGYWITFAPDSRHAFVALSTTGQAAMIDTQTRRVVGLFEAGRSPKRNLVLQSPM